MTGRPRDRTAEMNGGSAASYLSRAPRVPFFNASFHKFGSKWAFRLPGATRDRFRCTVEASPGHIQRQRMCFLCVLLLALES